MSTRQVAIKALSIYVQKNQDLGESRRLCWGAGIIAVSGGKATKLFLPATREAFKRMTAAYGVEKVEVFEVCNCAESHLWMKLVEKGLTPKNVEIWTVQQTRKFSTKFDSACGNCNQWVFREFKSMNSN